MTSAEVSECTACGRHIAANSGRAIVDAVFCLPCMNYNGRRLHAQFHAHCPDDWHDMYDHLHALVISDDSFMTFDAERNTDDCQQ